MGCGCCGSGAPIYTGEEYVNKPISKKPTVKVIKKNETTNQSSN